MSDGGARTHGLWRWLLAALVVATVAAVAAVALLWPPDPKPRAVAATCWNAVSVFFSKDFDMQAVAKRLRADRRITEVIVEPQQEAELRMQDEFADVALSPSIAEPMASALHLFAVDGLDTTKLAVKLTKEIAAAGSAAPAPCQKPPPTGCGPIEPISLSRDPAAQPPGCTPPKAPDVQPRLVRCGQNIVVTFDSERALNAASTWVESDGRFSDEEYSYSEMVLTVRPGHDAREVADDVLASLPKGATDAHVQGCIALPHPVFSSR